MTCSSTFGMDRDGRAASRGFCGMGWRPLEIAAVVIAFAAWWPIGLALVAYKIAQRRGMRWQDVAAQARDTFGRGPFGGARTPWQPFPAASGNSAFDEWRATELAKLEEERRRLDAAHRDFADHLDRLRRAKDREEFDSFMAASRDTPPAA